MRQVGRISLSNRGGFVASLHFVFWDDNGMEHEVRGSDNFPVLQSVELSPGQVGVPDGAVFTIRVGVVAGRDNRSRQLFIYRAGLEDTALFEISGTTLSNSLTLNGIRQSLSPVAPQSLSPVGPQPLQPMFLGALGRALVNHGPQIARTGLGFASTVAAHTLGHKLGDEWVHATRPQSVGNAAVGGEPSDHEYAALVPQGLIGGLAGALFNTLAPIVQQTLPMIPFSVNSPSQQQEGARSGSIDPQWLGGLVQVLVPTITPLIGKLAHDLATSFVSQSVYGSSAAPVNVGISPAVPTRSAPLLAGAPI